MTHRKHPTPLSDDDDPLIQQQIATDPDDAEATDEQLAQARPFAAVFPALAGSMKRLRGRPRLDSPKQLISLRLSKSVIAKFQATGKGWQALINDVLEQADI